MFTTLLLAAALTCQTPPYPGRPGVVGVQIPIPPGATAAERARIEGLNRRMAAQAKAHAASAGMSPQSRGDRSMIDNGPRIDFAPMGGVFIERDRSGVMVHGLDYSTRYIPPGGVYPGYMPIAPVPNGFTGPPALQRRKPLGRSARPNR